MSRLDSTLVGSIQHLTVIGIIINCAKEQSQI